MKLDAEAIRRLCEARGVPVSRVLRDAGISRTAYYSLLRRDSVLPKTVQKLAAALDVRESELLDDTASEERRAKHRMSLAKRIAGQGREVSFENVWHTLTLLDEPPLARLNRALRRGRTRTV